VVSFSNFSFLVLFESLSVEGCLHLAVEFWDIYILLENLLYFAGGICFYKHAIHYRLTVSLLSRFLDYSPTAPIVLGGMLCNVTEAQYQWPGKRLNL
jgi:hypothetical protein